MKTSREYVLKRLKELAKDKPKWGRRTLRPRKVHV